ncbi:2-aminoethylphosphonate--pyruvate transaminase [Curvivirga aplysinae]|uniref:2-aminoethylphosphonate--pyruvate transaminase n=1 Tax=Curvivirga aplysinae TaxID=2529852 RepID=UPI0012BBACBA|nr:2-aminoethylphosphonate--pyruvate transaminase [Curvivirga aplysinae]MTI10759.1 2-aminoethylphosphonate--pyruvate transaminase [Curvivirga aplysinae]
MTKQTPRENGPFADLASAGTEPALLTPGPLTTSMRTKESMLRDWGSWDDDFKAISKEIRIRLVDMCDGGEDYDCALMQGSGSFSVEAMLSSFIPKNGSKTLLLMNGAYGQRSKKTMDYLDRDYVELDKGDYLPPMPNEVADILDSDPAISHVVLVHCETSSGILNPLKEISDVVVAKGRKLLVDSMSAFGAVPLSVKDIPFEAMVSSANKCIEGVPGFGFIVAKKSALEAAKGNSHSLALDVHDQWAHMNKTGQWRFTPPTHTVVAFLEALYQHEEEGNVEGRHGRYLNNRQVLVKGMRELGFETLLEDRWLSPIITTFFCPAHKNFDFATFYAEIKKEGYIIYPGKLTVVDSFRVGNIGQLFEEDMNGVLAAMKKACVSMGVDDCSPPAEALEQRKLQA